MNEPTGDAMCRQHPAHPRELSDQIRYYAAQRSTGVEMHRFVLRHGREFINPVWRPLLHAGKSECYRNALTAALSQGDLRYAEGFGWSDNLAIPVEHAWCVDGGGRPIEVTWSSRFYMNVHYYGVVFRRAFVEKLFHQANLPPFLERNWLLKLDTMSEGEWRDPICAPIKQQARPQ